MTKKEELKELLINIKKAVDEQINTIDTISEEEAEQYLPHYSQMLQDAYCPE